MIINTSLCSFISFLDLPSLLEVSEFLLLYQWTDSTFNRWCRCIKIHVSERLLIGCTAPMDLCENVWGFQIYCLHDKHTHRMIKDPLRSL